MSNGPGSAAGAVLAVGETMAVVAPTFSEPFARAEQFRVDAGGAESNVAAHVVALGHPARWFSRVGSDALGVRVLDQLRRRGVQVDDVMVDSEHPTGLYVKDPGAAVTYYRAGSAASCLGPADAQRVELAGVRVLHVSGITAAISTSAAQFLDALIEHAHREEVLVSFDVNHRRSLWAVDRAAAALDILVRRADLVFVGRDEAQLLWGTETARDVHARFADVPELVVKDAEIGATWFGASTEIFAPALPVEVLDAVGAGDAFAGGFLAALLDGVPVGARLRAGHARAALTLRTTGDTFDEGIPT
jgi:2-dehydro-3-deoxygluconokinase